MAGETVREKEAREGAETPSAPRKFEAVIDLAACIRDQRAWVAKQLGESREAERLLAEERRRLEAMEAEMAKLIGGGA